MDPLLGAIVTIAAPVGWGILVALVIGPGPRKVVAIALGTIALIAPFYAPTEVGILRGASANFLAVQLFMTIDLSRSPRPWALWERLVRVLAFIDPRVARRSRPRIEPWMVVRFFVALGSSAILLWTIAWIGPAPSDNALLFLRWIVGAVFSYVGFEALHLFVMIPVRLAGIESPLFHRDPILSRSLAEFWGERWNRVIGGWLRRNCFMPWVKRGRPWIGLVAAFFVSALLHGYMMWPALGGLWALSFGSFFLVQPLLLLVERALRLRKRPPWVGRLWAGGALLLFSPLFVEPALRAFEAVWA